MPQVGGHWELVVVRVTQVSIHRDVGVHLPGIGSLLLNLLVQVANLLSIVLVLSLEGASRNLCDHRVCRHLV
jgi:hypothetical protein